MKRNETSEAALLGGIVKEPGFNLKRMLGFSLCIISIIMGAILSIVLY